MADTGYRLSCAVAHIVPCAEIIVVSSRAGIFCDRAFLWYKAAENMLKTLFVMHAVMDDRMRRKDKHRYRPLMLL